MGIGRDWGALGGLLGALEGLRVLGELVEQAPKSVLRGQVPQKVPSGWQQLSEPGPRGGVGEG